MNSFIADVYDNPRPTGRDISLSNIDCQDDFICRLSRKLKVTEFPEFPEIGKFRFSVSRCDVHTQLEEGGRPRIMSSLTRIASSYSSLIHNDLDTMIKTFEVAIKR